MTPPPRVEQETRTIRIVEDRWSTFRHIVEAIAIVAAGLWAFYTFVYQERIKPAAAPAALDASVSVRRLGRDARRDILSVDIVFRNVGKTEIDIAADGYNVWGVRYGTKPAVARHETASRYSYSDDIPTESVTVIDAFAELRDAAIGGRRGQHIILEPDAVETIPDIVVVQRGRYDSIRAQVIAVPVKTSTAARIPIDVVDRKGGTYWIVTGTGSDVAEDDNETEFALIP